MGMINCQNPIPAFLFSRIPNIFFGPGEFRRLSEIISRAGGPVLVITGAASFRSSFHWQDLLHMLRTDAISFFECSLSGEPTVDQIDNLVSAFSGKGVGMVIAIGGGSVIDGGKAVSAMLPVQGSVMDFLEGVGTRTHSGKKIPFVAVPTTAGTGSEATKNAVIRGNGHRHENFVPDAAIIDPELMLSCPSDITAACGMDAFSQLLESFVSTKATPMTDALSFSGLQHMKEALLPVSTTEGKNIDHRAAMAYGALISGITLANAGLGVAHGLAGPLGGLVEIPHGLACGLLLGPATAMNIRFLERQDDGSSTALRKYARVGHLLRNSGAEDVEQGCRFLIEELKNWKDQLALPAPGSLEIAPAQLDETARLSGNKNNPVQLEEEDRRELLSLSF
jgi:alcohol dehydrogenase class IV